MQPDDLVRLRHMIDAAREACAFVAQASRADLDADRKLALSLIKSIEIIGEAASKVSDVCKAKCLQIPWLDIIAMRNRLIHGYFDIDLDVVWQTVTVELPPLIAELEDVI